MRVIVQGQFRLRLLETKENYAPRSARVLALAGQAVRLVRNVAANYAIRQPAARSQICARLLQLANCGFLQL
jgi:hypothetical protein